MNLKKGMHILKGSTLVLALFLSTQASASFVIDSDTYAAQINSGQNITASIIKGQYSFLDVSTNTEFVRADLMNNGYCANAVSLNVGQCTISPQGVDAAVLSSSDGWSLGSGYQLRDAFSNYTPYFIWPGAFGAPGNQNDYRFNNAIPDLSPHISGDGRTNADYYGNYNTFNDFVLDVYGWFAPLEGQAGTNYSLLGYDPSGASTLSAMVYAEQSSSNTGDYSIRHAITSISTTPSDGTFVHYYGDVSLIVQRTFNGEFLDLGAVSNVSLPLGLPVLSMCFLFFCSVRKKY